MRTDPRNGFITSLLVAGAAVAWLLALSVAADTLYEALGMAMHAITFLAIFLAIAGALVALLFRRFMAVRADLLAGRDVLDRWSVDATAWKAFAGPAETMARGEKLALLLMMWGLVVVICGGLAIAVPRDAHIFGWIGAGIAAVAAVGFLLGTRTDASHLAFVDGVVIVGRRGMMVNRVLHVWAAPLTWLVGARVDRRPQPMLSVEYAYWMRYGPQYVTVRAPLPMDGIARAEEVATTLCATAGRRLPARRRPTQQTRSEI